MEPQIRRRPGRPPYLKPSIAQSDSALADAQMVAPEPVSKSEDIVVQVGERTITRRTRRPFGMHAMKLAAEIRPGFHRHWFNDKGDRIREATDAGYTHVLNEAGKPIEKIVNSHNSGGLGSTRAFLMEIPEEWWIEDQVTEQEHIDQFETEIRRGNVGDDSMPGKDGRYLKKADIRFANR
jgi:hypothetical protein